MALPKAVQKISDKVDQHFIDSGAVEGEQKPGVVIPGNNTLHVESEDWEKRFKNYKATTDQTITNLRSELVTAQQKSGQDDNKIANLTERMQALELAAKPAEVTDPAANEFDITQLPKELRDGYDEVFLKNIVAIVQQMKGTGNDNKTILELKQELDDLKGSVTVNNQNNALSAREKYYEALDKAQPTWEQIGEMPEFIEFLKGRVSKLLPQTYGQVLATADEQSNAEDVLSVIADYKQAGGRINNGTGLEGHITPDGGAANNWDLGLQNQPQALSEAFINQFNADVTKGKYKDKPEKYAAIEKQIKAYYTAPG